MRELKFRIAYQHEETGRITFRYISLGEAIPFLGKGYPAIGRGQYTGLKDRNGTEVYEWDVLKSYENILWRVQWNNEKAEFELSWHGGPQPVYYRAGLYLVKDTRCEIVGNIYENPELVAAQSR